MKIRKKKYHHQFLSLGLLAALCVAGCSETVYESNISASLTPHYLTVSSDNLNFDSNASSKDVYVESPGNSWTTTSPDNWLTLSPSSGSGDRTLTVKVTGNTKGDESRLAVAYINSSAKDWNYKLPLTVTQNAATAILTVSDSSIDLDAMAGASAMVTVETNIDWTATCSRDWLTLTPSNDGKSLKLTAQENTEGNARYCYVSVEGDKVNLSRSITVVQDAPNMSANLADLSFSNKAGSYVLSVTSDAAWTASVSDYSWIEVSQLNGTAGTSRVTVSVTENESTNDRTGYVYFTIGSKTVSVKVNQNGIFITPASTSFMFSSYAESQNLRVNSNTNWSVKNTNDWVSVDPVEGVDTMLVALTVTENISINSRVGYIYVQNPGGNLSQKVEVTQNGKSISFNESQLSFSDLAGTSNFEITSDGDWNIVNNDDWITVSPTSGSGNATVYVTVTENYAREERSGVLTVTMAESIKEVNVVQTGKYFQIENGNLTVSSLGGSIDVSISSNENWKAMVVDAVPWVSLSESEGLGDITLQIAVGENATPNYRSATVKFTTDSGYEIDLTVMQNGRYLTVSQTRLMFFYEAASSAPVVIETDCQYTVTQTGNWFTVDQTSSSFTVTVPQNNTDHNRTGTIVVSLTNLQEGELSITIPVIQYCKGGDFITNGYGDDTNWDNPSTSGSFGKDEYGSDSNWDATGTTVFTIQIVGYQTDTNRDKINPDSSWDKTDYGSDSNYDTDKVSVTMDKPGYGSDSNYDIDNVSVTMDKTGYGSDSNYDTDNASVTMDKTGYGSDSNYGTDNSSVTMDKTGYGSDSDLDSTNSSASLDKTNYETDTDLDATTSSNVIKKRNIKNN